MKPEIPKFFRSFLPKGTRANPEPKESAPAPPIKDYYKEQIVNGVRRFSEQLPKGVFRTILVRDDNSIDFTPLVPYLRGIPSEPFYMSKETYEIFEKHEKHIPPLMDKVQRAVDQYVREHKEYPIMPYDHTRKVNPYVLMQEGLLESMPEMDFYFTKYDGLITHKKPEKKFR